MSHHNPTSHDAHGDSHGELGHIIPYRIYVTVFITLLALTVITVIVAKSPVFHFSAAWINVFIAILIATVKATLVAMFFMHLKYENRITVLYVFFPLFLLALLIGLLFLDNPFRDNAGRPPIPLKSSAQVAAPAQH